MKTVPVQQRIMGNIGSLLDDHEEYNAKMERKTRKGTAKPDDIAFAEGLEMVVEHLRKFYDYWETRC